MDYPGKNALIACTCALCLTAGYACEQFAHHPVDVTPTQAQYSGGTVGTLASKQVFAPAPPAAPVDGYRWRQVRLDDT